MSLLQRVAVAAVILVAWASQAGAQIVFNEVLLRRGSGDPHADQILELKNSGAVPLNVGDWIIAHETATQSKIPSGLTIPGGGLLVVHFNKTGTNTATDVFFPSDELSETSDCALYVNGTTNFGSAANLRAFIQWGGVPATGHQSVANQAGLWTAGTYVPSVAAGHSFELCASNAASPTSYVDQGTPTIGRNNGCGVDTENVSWGSVKATFRY